MLYQLPINGNWVDPKQIVRVVFLPGERSEAICAGLPALEFMPRVVLHLAGGGYELIECDLTETAVHIRDEVAARANAAASREPEPEQPVARS